MSDPMTQWLQQLEAMGQQFRKATGQAGMGSAVDPMAAWARLATPPSADAEAMVERFSRQAQDYLALMRGIAAGQGQGDAAGLARAWRDALAASTGGNPFLATLGMINTDGARSFEQLAGGAEAWLAPFAGQLQSWLALPAFGPAREQQQALQQLARDQLALQQARNRFQALLLEAGEQAFVRFEHKLEERSEPGRQLESARALYDLWIDAAEEAWSELALSPRFGQVFSEMSDAQMRVRRGVQEQLERACGELGLPTRTELDSAHRRIHAMARELRELRQRLGEMEAPAPAAVPRANARPTPAASAPQRRAGASRKATPKKARPRDDRAVERADPVPAPRAPRAPAARGTSRRKPGSR